MFHTPDMLWAMFSLMIPIFHMMSFPKWGPYGTMDEAMGTGRFSVMGDLGSYRYPR